MIVFLRIMHRHEKRREKAFSARWHPLLMQILSGEDGLPLPALPRRDHFLFLKHWNHFQETVRGNASARLSKAASRLGVNAVARRLLHHRNLNRQLLAILALGHLRDESAWNELLLMSASGNSAISIYAARALIQINPQKAAPHVLPMLLQRDDWDIMRSANLMQESHDFLGAELVRTLASLSGTRLLRGLKLAEALHLQIPQPQQVDLFGPQQPVEVVIATLRIAAGAQVLDIVRSKASDADWRVRVQAARALGRIGDISDIPILMNLMKDPQWWIRYRSAQALVDLPGLQPGQLDQLLVSLTDRYARDILNQVLAERGHPSRSS